MQVQPQLGSGYYAPGSVLLPEHAWAWKGCVGAWSPMLGRQGNTLYDWSGYGNHGTLTNMDAGTDYVPSQVLWQSGYILDFDGSNDYVYRNTAPSGSVGSAVVWFKTTSATAGRLWASSDEASNFLYISLLLLDTGRLTFQQQPGFGSNNSLVFGDVAVNDGAWHCGVVVANGSEWKLYVDGRLQSLTLLTGTNNGGWFDSVPNRDNFTIGIMRRTSLATPFSGQIASVMLYSDVLNAYAVSQLYRIGPIGPYQYRIPSMLGRGASGSANGAAAYYYRHLTSQVLR